MVVTLQSFDTVKALNCRVMTGTCTSPSLLIFAIFFQVQLAAEVALIESDVLTGLVETLLLLE